MKLHNYIIEYIHYILLRDTIMAASIPYSVFVDPEWFLLGDGMEELPCDEPISTSLEDLDAIDFSSPHQEFESDTAGVWTDLGLSTTQVQ